MGYTRKGMLLVMLLMVLITACGKSPEKARKELGQMNIEYTEDSFIKHLKNGDKIIVELFLTAGMDPNLKGSGGDPILFAAVSGGIDVVKLMIAKGADVNAHGGGGTALSIAAYLGKVDIVKTLIEKGADINAKSDTGTTPLMMACISPLANTTEVVKVLLDNKTCDINAENTRSGDMAGMNALLFAIKQDHFESAKLLLDKGASPKSKSKDGTTALMQAIFKNNIELVKILLNKGADVNAATISGKLPGMTALIWAVSGENPDTNIIDILLNKGANVNAKTIDGITALSMAKYGGYTDIADLLKKAGAEE